MEGINWEATQAIFTQHSSYLSLSKPNTWKVEVSIEGNEGITDCSKHDGNVYDDGGVRGSDMQSSAAEFLRECNNIFSSTFQALLL